MSTEVDPTACADDAGTGFKGDVAVDDGDGCDAADDDDEEAVAADVVVALVAIARAPEDICDDVCEPAAAEEALKADDCARKAARKFARNGRFVDMMEAEDEDEDEGELELELELELKNDIQELQIDLRNETRRT